MTRITNQSSIINKHVAQRTCVACRAVKTKRELVRLVHTAQGNIEIDEYGKKTGRGAYLCHEWRCWEKGLNSNRLEYALRGKLSQDIREELTKQAKDILKGDN
ncbi:RNase P modulator RnpM [Chloroflexota bacterium]